MIKWMTKIFKTHYALLQWNRNSVELSRPMGLLLLMVISFNISNSIFCELYQSWRSLLGKILVNSITAKIQQISYVDRRAYVNAQSVSTWWGAVYMCITVETNTKEIGNIMDIWTNLTIYQILSINLWILADILTVEVTPSPRLWLLIFYLPRRRRPGTGDIATPPVRLSVCLSVLHV